MHNIKGMMVIALHQLLKLLMDYVSQDCVLLLIQHLIQILNAKIIHIYAIQMGKDALL